MEFINQHIFETIYIAFNQHYFTFALGIFLIWKLRVTGALLLTHSLLFWIFISNYYYELFEVSDLQKQAYGSFYESNVFNAIDLGIISIPIILFIGLLIDLLMLKRSKKMIKL